ncbi:MAG TPA: hypothetical protein VHS09_17160, partial [Polyangiaceae bacterium]|nr:hypothetical protein [Polyangiaceae bacterium]
MTFSVRTKLFLVSIALIAASMGSADAYLTPTIANHLTERIRADLLVRARLVAREAAASPAPLAPTEPSWDALARALGKTANGRVTFIASDGVVVGDSEVPAADLPRLENHASRPEVRDALATGEGEAERLSTTVQQPMVYAAVRFERGGVVAGVARVAELLSEVEAARADMRRLIWIGS